MRFDYFNGIGMHKLGSCATSEMEICRVTLEAFNRLASE